jgi:hypothetical protein
MVLINVGFNIDKIDESSFHSFGSLGSLASSSRSFTLSRCEQQRGHGRNRR